MGANVYLDGFQRFFLSEGGDIARGQREFLPKRNHERRCPWGIERNGCVPMLTCRGRTPGTPQDLHKPRQAGTKGMRILVSTHFCTDERARIADISVGSATNRSTNTTRRMYSVSRPDASTNIHNPSALTALTTMPACPASTGGPQLYCSALSLNITGKRQYLCVRRGSGADESDGAEPSVFSSPVSGLDTGRCGVVLNASHLRCSSRRSRYHRPQGQPRWSWAAALSTGTSP